jgi:ribosomal protein S18 acetylase RimI-like enzyme
MSSSYSPITIEIADLNDSLQGESVVALMDGYASGLSGGGEGLSHFAKQHLPRELAKRPNALVLIAWSQVPGESIRTAAGLTVCFEAFSTFKCKPILNIHDVIVSSDFRRRGIAKKLFERLEAIAIERGCCKLTLEVLEGNTGAVELYRSIGFEPYELDPAMGRAMFWQKELTSTGIETGPRFA